MPGKPDRISEAETARVGPSNSMLAVDADQSVIECDPLPRIAPLIWRANLASLFAGRSAIAGGHQTSSRLPDSLTPLQSGLKRTPATNQTAPGISACVTVELLAGGTTDRHGTERQLFRVSGY